MSKRREEETLVNSIWYSPSTRLIINCRISHSNDNSVWCRATMTASLRSLLASLLVVVVVVSELKVKVFFSTVLLCTGRLIDILAAREGDKQADSFFRIRIVSRASRAQKRRVNKPDEQRCRAWWEQTSEGKKVAEWIGMSLCRTCWVDN